MIHVRDDGDITNIRIAAFHDSLIDRKLGRKRAACRALRFGA
jgi:hypothetical protein